MKRREVKSNGKKERYTHLNEDFQRIERRDKKAFLSDQCKEIKENNRNGKGVHQGCILSRCLVNLYAEYIMRNVGLEKMQAEIKISGRNIKASDIQMTLPLWQKVKKT